jgi:hypothetical protein
MPSAEKAHDVPGAIDDECEQVRDLAAEDAHVERGWVGEGGKAPVESNPAAILAPHFDVRVDANGSSRATDSFELGVSPTACMLSARNTSALKTDRSAPVSARKATSN